MVSVGNVLASMLENSSGAVSIDFAHEKKREKTLMPKNTKEETSIPTMMVYMRDAMTANRLHLALAAHLARFKAYFVGLFSPVTSMLISAFISLGLLVLSFSFMTLCNCLEQMYE